MTANTNRLQPEAAAKRAAFIRKHPDLSADELVKLGKRFGVPGMVASVVYYERAKLRLETARPKSAEPETPPTLATVEAPQSAGRAPSSRRPMGIEHVSARTELRRLIRRVGLDVAEQELAELRDFGESA